MSEVVTTRSEPLEVVSETGWLQALLGWARLGSNQPKASTAASSNGPESPHEQGFQSVDVGAWERANRLSTAAPVVVGWSDAEVVFDFTLGRADRKGEVVAPPGVFCRPPPWGIHTGLLIDHDDRVAMLDVYDRVTAAFDELGAVGAE